MGIPNKLDIDHLEKNMARGSVMVGGPVFGPQPRLKQAVFVAVAIVAITAIVALLTGCATHGYIYRPIPADMIPPAPEVPKIKAEELQCLSDDAYERLANRDRLRKQYAEELRALLGVGGDAER